MVTKVNTINDIENSLNWGFHDSRLLSIHVDYLQRQVDFDIDIQDSDFEATKPTDPVVFRPGRLTLLDVYFCVIDPPDPRYQSSENKGLWIANTGPVTSAEMLCKLPVNSLPKGASVYWFFINDWNAFIYVAYMDARFEWRGTTATKAGA
jgi:hypothetical protein